MRRAEKLFLVLLVIGLLGAGGIAFGEKAFAPGERRPAAVLPPPGVTVLPLETRAAPSAPADRKSASPTPALTGAQWARQTYGKRLIRRLYIPAAQVRALVVPITWHWDDIRNVPSWESPKAEVGWVIGSALPDDREGTIILYAHNNMYQAVFRELGHLSRGDKIYLYTGDGTQKWTYIVDSVQIIAVDDEAGMQRMARALRNAAGPRLILLSCWPPNNNTSRVMVIAFPQQMW